MSAAGDAVEGSTLEVSVALACDEGDASLPWWVSGSSSTSSPAVTPPSVSSASTSVDVPPEVVTAVDAGSVDVSKDVDVKGDVTGEEGVVAVSEGGSSEAVEVGEAEAAEVEFPLPVVVAPSSWATTKDEQQATNRNSAKYSSTVTLT